MILDNSQAIEIIKQNKSVHPKLQELRENSKELYALIEGDDFVDELISRIEGIEGEKKAEARKKYSRDIQDFFERLFQPIDNIAYATGGNKVYKIEDEDVKKEFLKTINNIKDSNTLQHWVMNVAIKLSHVDPNGIMFMEYTTEPRKEVYPTYKSINDIRKYKKRGQLVEWLLFEPYDVESEEEGTWQYWRIVDDINDRTFRQKGEVIELVEALSFEHPFGEVPALINSNLVKVGADYRISPITPILGMSREFARDQSIKTIYKFLQGFPISWRYVMECEDCKGTGKAESSSCGKCDGRGYLNKGDVTDLATIPLPKEGDPTIDTIAGFITPDLDTWNQYNDELNLFEKLATRTFWGTLAGLEEAIGGRKTTTEVIFNKQPIENRLNKYADYAEFVEWRMSEWVLNFLDNSKDKMDKQIVVKYGRNYVIEPSDTILARYEEAKGKQENDIVLDELFKQYLQATYRTDPIELSINILKSEIEPYLHQTTKDVADIFGNIEAQRKVLFGKWWGTLRKADLEKGKIALSQEFEAWFNENKVENTQNNTDE